jgi:hypothetical protein
MTVNSRDDRQRPEHRAHITIAISGAISSSKRRVLSTTPPARNANGQKLGKSFLARPQTEKKNPACAGLL